MARPRKPTATKELAGTLRKDRTNPKEPKLAVALPDVDESLAYLSPLAKKLWPDISKVLLGMGVLTIADGAALGLLAEALAEGIIARRTIEACGGATYLSEGRDGQTLIKAHPAFAQAADADRRFMALASQFGLTPAARSRVSTDLTTKVKNVFEEI